MHKNSGKVKHDPTAFGIAFPAAHRKPHFGGTIFNFITQRLYMNRRCAAHEHEPIGNDCFVSHMDRNNIVCSFCIGGIHNALYAIFKFFAKPEFRFRKDVFVFVISFHSSSDYIYIDIIFINRTSFYSTLPVSNSAGIKSA